MKKSKKVLSPLPVLFILNSLSIGGNETSALLLAKNLDKKLFTPKILVLNGEFRDMECEFIVNDIEIIYMRSKLSNILLLFFEFFTILKKHKIRVVMSYTFTYQVILLQFISLLALVKHRILRVSGSPDGKKLMKKLFFVQFMARFLITKEIVVSNAVYNWVSQIGGFPMNRVSVIYNGTCSTVHEVGITNQRKNLQVIMISRMDDAKDQWTLISAMSEVQKVFPGANLTLVGDGPLRCKLEQHAKSLGCSVSFLGFRRDVRQLLFDSSIFVLSTKTEGFPNALLEAMAAGLPVVASDIPPCSEILEKGSSGQLFKVGSVIELVNIIIDLFEDEGVILSWAAKAKKRSENFSMKNMVNEYQKNLGNN